MSSPQKAAGASASAASGGEATADVANWGRLGFLTPEQQEALDVFLADVNRTNRDGLLMAKYSIESEEEVSLRFLRARKFDVSAACTLLEECKKKMLEGQSALCETLAPDVCAQCDLDVLKTFYPHAMAGFDKLGRPLLWEQSGQLNIPAIQTMTSKESLMAYHWWTMERKLDEQFSLAAATAAAQAAAASRLEEAERTGQAAKAAAIAEATASTNSSAPPPLPRSPPPSSPPPPPPPLPRLRAPPIATCAILDFTGFGRAQCTGAAMDQLKMFVSTDNTCYPETLGKMMVCVCVVCVCVLLGCPVVCKWKKYSRTHTHKHARMHTHTHTHTHR